MDDVTRRRIVAASQQLFSACWTAYTQHPTLTERVQLQKVMDTIKRDCTTDGTGLGPEWEKFAKTLPGFNEMWKQLSRIVAECVDQMRKDPPKTD